MRHLAPVPTPATKSILGLAKVLRLPRNLYLGLKKCCACHEILTLRNLRVAVTMGPRPRPSRTVPRPSRTGAAAEVPFTHLRQRRPAPCHVFAQTLSFRALRQAAGILPLPRNLHFLIYFKSLSNTFLHPDKGTLQIPYILQVVPGERSVFIAIHVTQFGKLVEGPLEREILKEPEFPIFPNRQGKS